MAENIKTNFQKAKIIWPISTKRPKRVRKNVVDGTQIGLVKTQVYGPWTIEPSFKILRQISWFLIGTWFL